MTVDSEAIFALAAHSHNEARSLEELDGSLAAAWLDERVAETLFVARGVGRPLWIGSRQARALLRLDPRRARGRRALHRGRSCASARSTTGTFLALRASRIVRDERFRPDLGYRDPVALPAVRAPQEGVSCLQRLAALAAYRCALSSRPSVETRTPCSSRRSRTRNWKVDHAPRRASSIR